MTWTRTRKKWQNKKRKKIEKTYLIEELKERCEENETKIQEEKERLEAEIAKINAQASEEIQKANERICLLETEKNVIDLEIVSINKVHDGQLEEYNKMFTAFQKDIDCKEKRNKLKQKQHFYSSAKEIANLTKHDSKVLKHSLTFPIADTHRSKSIFILVKNTSTSEQQKLVKLVLSTATKLMSSTTTQNEAKINKSINEGKKNMAALKIMDSKMTGCFLKGSLQQESMAKFKKILAVIQSFYQIELPNLKFCVDSCYPRTKCVQKKTRKFKPTRDCWSTSKVLFCSSRQR